MFRDGFLTEASASNVLIVNDGTIIAPPKDNLILPGITYDATLEFARDAGVPLDVRTVTQAEALAADEMWLSSSTKEVLAITTRSTARRSAAARRARCSARSGRRSRRRSRAPARCRCAWRRGLPRASRRQLPGSGRDRRRSGRDGTRARGRCARSHGHDFADEHDVVAGAVRAWWRHSSHATQPSISGASDQPSRCTTPAKRSACGREKRRASSTCSARRARSPRSARRPRTRRGCRERRARLHRISGGSSDTELNELAVKPT